MWLICLFFMQQDVDRGQRLNATVVTTGGDEFELYDLQVSGPDPFAFAMDTSGGTEFIPLNRISRISALAASGQYDIIYHTGEIVSGRIGTISFSGVNPERPNESFSVSIRRIERIHVVAGSQLRSCPQCGYEEHTELPYCPVCGTLLESGHFEEEAADESPPPALYRHRVNERD